MSFPTDIVCPYPIRVTSIIPYNQSCNGKRAKTDYTPRKPSSPLDYSLDFFCSNCSKTHMVGFIADGDKVKTFCLEGCYKAFNIGEEFLVKLSKEKK